jgi:hypothetical protein
MACDGFLARADSPGYDRRAQGTKDKGQGKIPVTRLSIVIPMLGNAERMEAGLVSVLENRPADCEVLLVLNAPYANPYQLDDEVHFVQAAEGASWVDSVNCGIQRASGDIVHILAPGVEVTPGWTETALERFDDDTVAAVAAVIVDRRHPSRVLAAGVGFGTGGRRRMVRRVDAAESVIGPHAAAGFFRKRLLEGLNGFAKVVGDAYADVDLGLRLQYLGLDTVVEPSALVSRDKLPRTGGGFGDGLRMERLFLRHLGLAGGWAAAMARPLTMVLGLCLRLLNPPKAVLHLLGRLTAWCESPLHLCQRRKVQKLARRMIEERPAIPPAGKRIDAKHADASRSLAPPLAGGTSLSPRRGCSQRAARS